MARALNIFGYIFPVLVVSVAMVLFCFYLRAKKKREAYDVTAPTRRERPSSISVIPLSGRREEDVRRTDSNPPRYSTVDPPPPYSLFDPKSRTVWPGGPPPAYRMYPITLPLAPRLWPAPGQPRPLTPPRLPSTPPQTQTGQSPPIAQNPR
ncbi:uncharacterized protein ACJ7VT_004976 [Polymixia lowei]